MADWNPVHAREVVRWPLREALLSYLARLKREAMENHRTELIVWAVLAPYSKKKTDPPRMPDILRGS